MEQTLLIIKPDALQRRLVGEIIRRLELKGLKIIGLKMVLLTESQARRLYVVHQGKPFYEGLVRFITSGPVVVLVLEGLQAIKVVRAMLGATFGFEAQPGTIRGDLGLSKGFNLVHASDSKETASYEIPIFFSPEELITYNLADLNWVYEETEKG
jgi:nucleoside-diphosphate kinase